MGSNKDKMQTLYEQTHGKLDKETTRNEVSKEYSSENASGPYTDKLLESELNKAVKGKKLEILSTSVKNGVKWFFVTCPWQSEHTTEHNPTECGLYVFNGWPIFKCQHSHCQDRRYKDFAQKVGIKAKLESDNSVTSDFIYKNNQLFYVNGEKNQHVSDGRLIVTQLFEYYDGTETTKHFGIGGTSWNGKELNPIVIDASRISSIRTVAIEQFGDDVVLDPRQTASAQAVTYLMQTAHSAPRELILSSTGFFRINGKLIYSHGDGAIGDDSIKTRLENNVSMYYMNDVPDGKTEKDAVMSVFQLLEVHDISVTGPCMSFALLPILTDILRRECQAQPFTLYMIGEKASGKTVFAKLMTSLYAAGMIDAAGTPSSFDSSPTALEITAHCLKDSLHLMDDNHPSNTKRESDRHTELMRYIVRSSANGTGRTRGTSDIKIRHGKAPRGLTVMTGEDRASIEQSCVDRMFFVDVPTVNFNEYSNQYETAVQNARNGLITAAMYRYISFIIENYDAFKTDVIKIYEKIKENSNSQRLDTRLSEHVSMLKTAFTLFSLYAVKSEFVSKEYADKIRDEVFESIDKAAENNLVELKESDPVETFLTALKTIILTQHRVVNLDIEPDYLENAKFKHPLSDRDIGWYNQEFYILDPELAQVAVYDLMQKQGEHFSASKQKVGKGLKERGLLVPGYDGTPTKNITIDGISKKRLVIPRNVIDRGQADINEILKGGE